MALKYTKWPWKYQMPKPYTNIFHCKSRQKWPKLGFLVWKYTYHLATLDGTRAILFRNFILWNSWRESRGIFLSAYIECQTASWFRFSEMTTLAKRYANLCEYRAASIKFIIKKIILLFKVQLKRMKTWRSWQRFFDLHKRAFPEKTAAAHIFLQSVYTQCFLLVSRQA
jgi:hypothetical protein